MNGFSIRWSVFLATVVLAHGCGKNINDASAGKVGPPQNLQALSLNDSTVALRWSAGTSDSAIAGYFVQFGTVRDSVPKSQLSFNAAPVGRGQTLFQVLSWNSDGSH